MKSSSRSLYQQLMQYEASRYICTSVNRKVGAMKDSSGRRKVHAFNSEGSYARTPVPLMHDISNIPWQGKDVKRKCVIQTAPLLS